MVENGTTACKWDTVIPFAPLWEAYKRVIKPKGAIVLFGSQPFTSALVMSNPAMFRDEWIWEKNRATRHLDANKRPLKAHESVLVFGILLPCYSPQKTSGHRVRWESNKISTCNENLAKILRENLQQRRGPATEFRFPRSVQEFNVESGKICGLHPTQKPVALLEYLVRTYTNPGDLVLDNVMGSGTLPVACLNTGRHFIGIEKDDVYFDIAATRVRTRELELASTLDL